MAFLDDGLAVAAIPQVGSAALNHLFTTNAGDALGKAGMKFAASGGHLRKGVFVWRRPGDPVLKSFKFLMNPESIREAVAPVYAESMAPGQNRPTYQFINGGPREVSFTLKFFYAERKRSHVRDDLRNLQRLTQRPTGGAGYGTFEGPPVIYFFFGEYFDGTPFLVHKVESTAKEMFDPATLLPLRMDVDLTLKEVAPVSGNSRPNLPLSQQTGGGGIFGGLI